MSGVVERLTDGEDHPVDAGRTRDSLDAFRRRLETGHPFVRFPDTKGGTELTVPMDDERSDVSAAAPGADGDTVHIEGDLVLDGVPVRCVADLRLPDLEGTGRLERLGDRPGEGGGGRRRGRGSEDE